MTPDQDLGDLMSTLYQEFLRVYGDADLACAAAAAAIEHLLASDRDDHARRAA